MLVGWKEEERVTYDDVPRVLVPANVRDLEDQRAFRVGCVPVPGLELLEVGCVFLLVRACELLQRAAVVARVVELGVDLPAFLFQSGSEAYGMDGSVQFGERHVMRRTVLEFWRGYVAAVIPLLM